MTPKFKEPTPLWRLKLQQRMSWSMMRPYCNIRRKVHDLITEYSGKPASLDDLRSKLQNRPPFRPLWRWTNRWRASYDRNRKCKDWSKFVQEGGLCIEHRMF
jgi:hypothetical protein